MVGKEGEDLSRHDKWLCMMYPRLRLLQKLLTSDGCLIVSISYHELHNLVALLREIFAARQIVVVTVQTSGVNLLGASTMCTNIWCLLYLRTFRQTLLTFVAVIVELPLKA